MVSFWAAKLEKYAKILGPHGQKRSRELRLKKIIYELHHDQTSYSRHTVSIKSCHSLNGLMASLVEVVVL